MPGWGLNLYRMESTMQEIDRIAEANAALDRRARQREAKAAALLELTPEAIKAEEERQRRHALGAASLGGIDYYGTPAEDDKDAQGYRAGENPNTPEQQAAAEALLEDPLEGVTSEMVEAAQEDGGHRWFGGLHTDDITYPEPSLSERLAAALQPVFASGEEPEVVGIGRAVFQWILVPSEENEGGYQLGLQLQVDEQPPGGFVAEIAQEQLESWAAGKGLQGNRIEHKQFVSALFERFLAVGLNETGNALVYALEQLMQSQEDGGPEKWDGAYMPTETAVGDADEPYLPEMSD